MFGLAALKLSAVLLSGALLALPLGVPGSAPVQDSTPDRSWMGVKKILVLADFVGPHDIVMPELTAERFCERVQKIAAANSPVPVSCVRMGDPRLDDGDAAVLVFHAAVRMLPRSSRLLVYTVRRHGGGGLEPAPVYFGSIPQAIPLTSPPDFAAIDAALGQSLGEVLPWLRAPDTRFLPLPRRED